jgi:hypothetical protein
MARAADREDREIAAAEGFVRGGPWRAGPCGASCARAAGGGKAWRDPDRAAVAVVTPAGRRSSGQSACSSIPRRGIGDLAGRTRRRVRQCGEHHPLVYGMRGWSRRGRRVRFCAARPCSAVVAPDARGDAGDAADEVGEDLGRRGARHEAIEQQMPAADEEAGARRGEVVAAVHVERLQAEREDADEGGGEDDEDLGHGVRSSPGFAPARYRERDQLGDLAHHAGADALLPEPRSPSRCVAGP